MPEQWMPVCQGRALEASELDAAAKELMAASGGRRIWLFYGDMGAGKTTLIKAICSQLGVTSGMSSPTFSIVNEYAGAKGEKIYHFDCYRLRNEAEAYDIGAEEYLDSGSYCFIEWPDRIQGLLETSTFKIKLTEAGPTTRQIEYTHDGEKEIRI